MSIAWDGSEASGGSVLGEMTPDGRYVAFWSDANNIVPGDPNQVADVFVRDLQTGTNRVASVTGTGQWSQGGQSLGGDISADGRYVAFLSDATNLVPGDSNGTRDVFIHDFISGTTERINVNGSGGQTSGSVYQPAISDDGRYVAFTSDASDLVPGDTNQKDDAFVRDRVTGTTARVSVGMGGVEANGRSIVESISSDGRYVLIASTASNLVPDDTNGVNGSDIFVFDRQLGTTTRVSLTNADAQVSSPTSDATMSPDARFVAFGNSASNLVPGDTNNGTDVFLRDTQAGTTTRVSVKTGGIQANAGSTPGSISSDGRYVSFFSTAQNIVSGDVNGLEDVFLHDREANTTIRVSTARDGGEPNDYSFLPFVSDHGQVAFISSASNLVPGDTGKGREVFLHTPLNPLPSVYVSDVSIVEPDSGSSTATFQVSLTESLPYNQRVSVNVITKAGTATGGSDYTGLASSTINFLPGESVKAVHVAVKGDLLKEGNETFQLVLSSPSGGVLGDATGTATIVDDEGTIGLYVSDTSVVEGNSGTTTATFDVTLSSPPGTGQQVSVRAATSNGTAAAGSDYVALPTTNIKFGPGEITKSVNVTVNSDNTAEPNETLHLNLSSAKLASIADSKATATILDDDVGPPGQLPPSIYVSDIAQIEGNSGSTSGTFTVSLSRASSDPVTVRVATGGGTATSGSDYASVSPTTLNFAPGQTTKTIDVSVNGDTLHEGNETFLLNLTSPSGAVLADAAGTATIIDEEGPFFLYVFDTASTENNSGVSPMDFDVSLSAAPASGQQVTVKFATAPGTATAGTDYVSLPLTTLTFNPGETSKTVTVAVKGDELVETDETLFLNLSAPAKNSVVADKQGKGTIRDDD